MTTYYKRQLSGSNWNDVASWSTVSATSSTNTGTYPIAGDTAVFEALSSSATVNVASACAVLDCTNWGARTLTMTAALSVSSSINLSSTTIFAGTAAITLVGNCSITSATTSSVALASGAFTHTLNGNFYALTLTITGNAVFNATASEILILRGNMTVSSYSLTGTATLKIVNTATIAGGSSLLATGLEMPFIIDASGFTITITSNVFFGGSFTMNAGTMAGGGWNFIKNTTITQNGGSITTTGIAFYTGTMTFATNFTCSGAVALEASCTFTGNYDVQFGSATVRTFTYTNNVNKITVAGSTLRAGTAVINGSDFRTAGLSGGGAITGTSKIILIGGTWTGAGTVGITNNLSIEGGTVTISGSVYYTGTSFTMTSGTLTGTATPILILNNNITLNQVGGTMTTFVTRLAGYTYTLGSNFTSTGACALVPNTTISGAYTITMGAVSASAGILTLTDANFTATGSTTKTGGFRIDGLGLRYRTAGLTGNFASSGTATITLTGGTWSGTSPNSSSVIEIAGNVTVSGTVTVQPTLFKIVSGNTTGGVFSIQSGTSVEQVGGTFTTDFSIGNCTLLSNIVGDGSFTRAAGTITLTGDYTMTFATASIATGVHVWNLSSTLTITGVTTIATNTITVNNFAFSTGTLNINVSAITLPKANFNFTNLSFATTSTLTVSSALVIGILTINGAATFTGNFDITCNEFISSGSFNTTLSSTTSIFTINSKILIVKGTIASSGASSPRYIKYLGTLANQGVAYVNFTDINASLGHTIYDFGIGGVHTLTRTANIVTIGGGSVGVGGFCYL